MPTNEEEQDSPGPTPGAQADPPTKPRVAIVIDDEQSVRRVCRAILDKSGWETHTVSSGSEGIELAQRVTPQLVLVDMSMPDMGGAETCRELRALQADLPVLFMSGFAELALQDGPPSEGRSGFIDKPFTPAQLVNAVRETLGEAPST